MKQYIRSAKTYISNHQKEFAIGTRVAAGIVILGFLAALIIYDRTPHYVYQPIKACDILTPTKAADLLGDKINGVDKNKPTIDNDLATSKCSYTDLNNNVEEMRFVALAVRSAIYDSGVQKNKTDFATARSNNDIEVVKDLGEAAYFNKTNGQLNILDGQKWMILSYGTKSAPTSTTVDKLVEVAHKVIR